LKELDCRLRHQAITEPEAVAGQTNRLKKALIIGEKIFLRQAAAGDCREFIALNRASVRLHRGLVGPPIDEKEFNAFLKRCRRSDNICLFACRAEDGAIVGSINFSQIFRGGFQSAYLGYHVGEPYANQGFMTEGIKLALSYAFEHLKLHRLEANIQPENRASIALVKRAGFVREGYSPRYLKIYGRWRDHERWAILAEDWRASRKRK
jgi:[ribosomal protein S5]-alanine N-acetyltransferase